MQFSDSQHPNSLLKYQHHFWLIILMYVTPYVVKDELRLIYLVVNILTKNIYLQWSVC